MWWIAIAAGLVLLALLVALIRFRPEYPGFAARLADASPVQYLRNRREGSFTPTRGLSDILGPLEKQPAPSPFTELERMGPAAARASAETGLVEPGTALGAAVVGAPPELPATPEPPAPERIEPPAGSDPFAAPVPPTPAASRPAAIPPADRVSARVARPRGPKPKGRTLRQRLTQSSVGHAIANRYAKPKIKGPSLAQRFRNSALARKFERTDMAEGMRARKAAKQLRATIEERQQEMSKRPPSPRDHLP